MSTSSNQFLFLKYHYIKQLLEHLINFYEHLPFLIKYIVSDLFCFPTSTFTAAPPEQVPLQF